jgi:hypothetical protein
MCPRQSKKGPYAYRVASTGSPQPPAKSPIELSLTPLRTAGETSMRRKGIKLRRGTGKGTLVIRWTLYPLVPGLMEPLSGLVEISLDSGLDNYLPWLTTLAE